MVLIAIDKHKRKILGYLCKNDDTVTYCCSECDFEFTSSSNLEEHMVKHEKPLNNENETITVTAEVAIDQNVQDEAVQPNGDEEKIEKDVEDKENCQNEPEEVMVPEEVILPEEVIVPQEEIPPNDVSIDSPVNLLSDVEKEKQLQLKYQVMKEKLLKNSFFYIYLEKYFR